jgi:cysteine desulfurase
VRFDFSMAGIDLAALSGHKIGGPPGTGALLVREGLILEPRIVGGGQEQGLRAGTENAPGIAAFGAAAEAALHGREAEGRHAGHLRTLLEEEVLAAVPGSRVVAREAERLPNTAQFLIPFDDEEMLILALDRAGFAVSAGSACAAGAHRRSRALSAMGLLGPNVASVRVSLGPGNSEEDVHAFARALETCVREALPA